MAELSSCYFIIPFGLMYINSPPPHFIPQASYQHKQEQVLQRTDSFEELLAENEIKKTKEMCKQVDRSWSWNKLSSTPKSEPPKVGAVAKFKADHRRNYSTGDVPYPEASGPKLMRSSGMRRNWTFEDVTEKQEKSIGQGDLELLYIVKEGGIPSILHKL
ncbi:unnamed protein product [Sphenostylis stenocarpa]|uniref:Uncharacterized protein n=1 Tax=Sphenostylis stenocarpa TaxID=92480 RepID=A0AA86S266_9FABA|nr:unnamed protein product [Sphenostylis stenocarpa]